MGQNSSEQKAKVLRNQYNQVKLELSAKRTFNELVYISLKARLQLLPTHILMMLLPEVDVCKKLINFFQIAEDDISPLSHKMCLGNLVLAATQVFEGFVLRLENRIDSLKYTETKLLSIVKKKMVHVIDLFEEVKKRTLKLNLIDEGDKVSFSDMLNQKKHFLELAPPWLKTICAEGSEQQIADFVGGVTVIVFDSGIKINGFVAFDAKYVYVSTGRRPQTIRHELSHGLLRHLRLDVGYPPSPMEMLNTALLLSPLQYELQINGEMVEAGWDLEYKYLGTEHGPDNEWPVFCVNDAEERDE